MEVEGVIRPIRGWNRGRWNRWRIWQFGTITFCKSTSSKVGDSTTWPRNSTTWFINSTMWSRNSTTWFEKPALGSFRDFVARFFSNSPRTGHTDLGSSRTKISASPRCEGDVEERRRPNFAIIPSESWKSAKWPDFVTRSGRICKEYDGN